MGHLLDNLLIFGRVLRQTGIDVPPERILDVVRALDLVDLSTRNDVYYACRTLLVRHPEQIPVFDAAFRAFWREHGDVSADADQAPPEESARLRRDEAMAPTALATTSSPESADREAPEDGLAAVRVWSDRSGLGSKDLAAFTADEMAAARVALNQLVWNPGERKTRRWVSGRGPRIDFRRSLRASLRTGGDIVSMARRTRRWRPRPLVLLCDVSRSMEIYSRMLLHFAHALTWRHQRVEAFLFATGLTRVTRQLRATRPAFALAGIARSVPDWSGGTRIGGVIKEFHQRWARRVLTGGAVVLLISDGWDLGDPVELRDQIARLQRRSHRVIWLNPLVGTIDYAPLTRGLQAALPFVDDFLPARTLNDLADLAVHLNALK
jgi:uncharacterized protein with von Willebrand factor type A (vWA) domain